MKQKKMQLNQEAMQKMIEVFSELVNENSQIGGEDEATLQKMNNTFALLGIPLEVSPRYHKALFKLKPSPALRPAGLFTARDRRMLKSLGFSRPAVNNSSANGYFWQRPKVEQVVEQAQESQSI